jgi:hypothetical protein
MATASTKQAWARGGTVFAATLLLLIGVFQFFQGLSAIMTNNFFVVGPNYTYSINLTTWGWIHLAIGVIAFLAGLALFTGNIVARGFAIGIVAISAIANFFFLPYYPLWSLLIIAVDIFAIWAIATMRRGEMGGYAETGGYAQTGMGATPAMSGAGARGGEWPENQPPAGRHWAPENVKEGTGQTAGQTQESAEEARQRAEAAARGMGRPESNPPQG